MIHSRNLAVRLGLPLLVGILALGTGGCSSTYFSTYGLSTTYTSHPGYGKHHATSRDCAKTRRYRHHRGYRYCGTSGRRYGGYGYGGPSFSFSSVWVGGSKYHGKHRHGHRGYGSGYRGKACGYR